MDHDNPSSAAPSAAPVLTDGVVTLRGHALTDVDGILEQCVDPESLRWTTVPRGYTREDAVAFVERGRSAWAQPDGVRSWAVEWVDDAGARRLGGTIDLRPGATVTVGELGFGLHPDARGRGLMARAVRLVCEHAFTTGGWGVPQHRVHWRAIVGNWGSRRTAWACGFTMHATIPESHPDPEGGDVALDTWSASIVTGDPMSPAAPWCTAPVVEGDGIRLRPWRPSDVGAIEPRDGDPTHWMPARSVLRRDTFAAWHQRRLELMASGESVEWCVADAESDRALGSMALFSRQGPIGDAAEIGYQLFPSARGRGVATTAARLAVAHGLAPVAEGGLGLRRLTAETAADNVASNAVLRASGFSSFGREHAVDALADGSWGDGLYWELVATEGVSVLG
ncbi:MAG: GCN5-related N-acetyltransferase [Humibacillus sp.]|nr:GCN5-related N-acetyltransferase [Humibacillus sp.]